MCFVFIRRIVISHAQNVGVQQEVEDHVEGKIHVQDVPYSMPLKEKEGREQRVTQQVFESAVASDVLEHFQLGNCLTIVIVFPENVMRHQAAIIEFDGVLVRALLPCLQTVVEVTRQRAHRDVGEGRHVELVHVTDVTASLEKQSHCFAATRPGRVMQWCVAFICKVREISNYNKNLHIRPSERVKILKSIA